MIGNKPFLLRPAAKDHLWGGSRLNDDFAKGIDMFPLAETWECSTHPDGISTVASGEHAGESLARVLQAHPEYLGTHSLAVTEGKPELPILIKLIDANRDLSVQVHPDDVYAREKENGAWGKTEMWYVLQVRKGAELVYGFNQDVSKECVRKAIKTETIGRYLNHVPAHKGDLFLIEAGTVHAIGAGVLVAEIQQNSNLTYRMYDYGRVDKNGKPRELHVDKALDVANLKASTSLPQPVRALKYQNGCASELLTRCKYFQVERLLLNTETHRDLTSFQTNGSSFCALLCTDGCGVLFGTDFMLNIFKGDCIFVPANSMELKLHGKAQFLSVCC